MTSDAKGNKTYYIPCINRKTRPFGGSRTFGAFSGPFMDPIEASGSPATERYNGPATGQSPYTGHRSLFAAAEINDFSALGFSC
ncbi:hypothetical protein Y032_0016g3043 [Ancylostoma ceylanicum]|uniref:Uncharacterized protein n=1 Tax=Ancylostoma ceylanicum TaxID=53326 RepID=A0A016V8B6_9BILA|nr:hypothetical protein Y032_0016g3043 [Ancylostoma ceylanicum]